MLFQWIWFFFGYTWDSHLPQVLWLIMTASHTCQRLPREVKGTGLSLLYPMRTMPWGSQIPQTQLKELQSPKTSNYFKHCQARGHNINPHNVEVFTDENHTIKYHIKEAIAITLYRWSMRDSNKILNFVSNCFALNFGKLFYLLNWFFLLVLH